MTTSPPVSRDPELILRIVNPIVKWLLHTPLHGLRSGNTIILNFAGRKSGKAYSIPVSYTRNQDTIRCFTSTNNAWWKNLRDGVPVTLLCKRQVLAGTATSVSANDAGGADLQYITEQLTDHLRHVPRDAQFHNVHWDAPGQPNAADVARAARQAVLITIAVQ